MCECARCDKMFEESDLIWVEVSSECSMQIIWTGRGQDKPKEEKMELICDGCLEKNATTTSSSSSSCDGDG